MIYKRQDHESYDDYVWRICSNKHDCTYDLNWKEVAEILNSELGENFSESKWRKNFMAEKRGFERAIVKNSSEEEFLEELQQKKLELELAKKKVQTESVFNNRVIREGARNEMLYERFIDAVQKTSRLPLPSFKKLPIQKSEKEYVFSLADIHVYKAFETYRNKYSKEIFESRMSKLFSEIVDICEKESVNHITILNGGDNLDGMIRNSQLKALELGLIDSVIEFRRFLAKWLSDLSEYVKIRYIHTPSANHTEIRPLGSRAGQFPNEDTEKLIISYLDDILSENKRISVETFNDMYAVFKVFDFNCVLVHGHNVKKEDSFLQNLSSYRRIFIDYLFVAHKHHREIQTIIEGVNHDCDFVRIPSIVGTDTYSESLIKGSKPSAILSVFDKDYGLVDSKKIMLNDLVVE